jgi:hypothetical protein
MTQQNAALVEQAAAAAESLQDQAASLAQAVAVFKIATAAGRLSAPPAQRAAAFIPGADRDRAAAMPRRAPRPAPQLEEDEWEEF